VTARILDGKATLAAIKAELTDRVAVLASRGVVPGLGTVLVGDDPGSTWYVGAKHKDSAQIGVTSIRRDLPATATQAEVEAVIDELNADPDCTGFLVQQPTGLDEMALLSRVDPQKDIDGLHPTNLGWLVLGKPAPLPCTPMGCIELLRRFDVPIAGAHVVIVGRGITVGRPLGLILTASRRTRPSPSATPGPRTSRRRCARATSSWPPRASPASSPPTWSSPVPRSSTSASHGRRQARRGRRRRRGRGRRLAQPQPRRRRADDAGHAAHERRGGRRAAGRPGVTP
jgi:hypothetical protein